MPRFGSCRADAVGLAAYLLWKNPGAHEVTRPLSREDSNALVARAEAQPAQLEGVVSALSQHAPERHVAEMVATLARWYEMGDGCVVASIRPPTLVGAVPEHLGVIWNRVPALVEHGLLGGSETPS